MANVTIAANHSSNDVVYNGSGSTWVDVVPGTDYFVFSGGSTSVDDEQPIPTQSQLIQAGLVLTGVQQIVDRYFLADVGSNLLREIFLMGNTTSQYVLAFDFDDSTATEPVLEMWDDSGLDTVTCTSLGAGTASNSWWRAICTTTSAPSADWTGTTLAGSTDGYYLNLNDGNGALSSADTLYCNLKIIIPASVTTGTSQTPVMAIKFASN